MENTDNEKKEISKIKIDDTVYQIKDTEVQWLLDILLQNAPKKSNNSTTSESINELSNSE